MKLLYLECLLWDKNIGMQEIMFVVKLHCVKNKLASLCYVRAYQLHAMLHAIFKMIPLFILHLLLRIHVVKCMDNKNSSNINVFVKNLCVYLKYLSMKLF